MQDLKAGAGIELVGRLLLSFITEGLPGRAEIELTFGMRLTAILPGDSQAELVLAMLDALAMLRPDQDFRTRWETLTTREREIAAHVCMGLTTNEIADKLYISPDTVNSHVYNCLRKLGMSKRAELRAITYTWAAAPAELENTGE